MGLRCHVRWSVSHRKTGAGMLSALISAACLCGWAISSPPVASAHEPQIVQDEGTRVVSPVIIESNRDVLERAARRAAEEAANPNRPPKRQWIKRTMKWGDTGSPFIEVTPPADSDVDVGGGHSLLSGTGGTIAGGVGPEPAVEEGGTQSEAPEGATPHGPVGITFPANVFTGAAPPDPNCAVGPEHIVTVVNTSMDIYTKLGDRTFSTTLDTFFAPLQGQGADWDFLTDPKCLYDQYQGFGRFIVIVLAIEFGQGGFGDSYVLVAVSTSSFAGGDNSQWLKFAVQTSTQTHWSDYPGMGLDETTLYLTYNMFPKQAGGVFVRQHLIDMRPFMQFQPPQQLTSQFFDNINDVSGGPSGTLQPAHSFGETRGEFFVSFQPFFSGQNHLSVYNRDGFGGSINTQRVWSVTVPEFTPASNGRQSGVSDVLDALGDRLINAVWRNNSLWCAHAVQSQNGAAVRWYEIDTSAYNPPQSTGAPILKQTGLVTTGPNGQIGQFDNIIPAINVNSAGDMLVCYTNTGPTSFPSLVYSHRLASDPLGFMQPSTLVVPGTRSYTGFQFGLEERWGDYAGNALDPTDEATFWMLHELAAINPSNWQCWVGSATLTVGGGGGGGPPPLPTPSSLQINRPNGGENFVTNTTERIEWSFSGNSAAPVILSLYRNGVFIGEIARDIPVADQLYNWTVGELSNNAPVPFDNRYQIRISALNNPAIFDQTDFLFTITPKVQVSAGVIDPNEQVQSALEFALGDQLRLTSAASQGLTPYFYVWSPQDFLDDPSSPTPRATPQRSITYTLTVRDGTGNEATDTVTLNLGNPLVVDAGPSKLFASGGSVVLEGAVVGGKPPYTITWRDCDPSNPACTTPVVSNLIQPLVSPTGTTVYFLRVTDADGTVRTDNVLVEPGFTINLENAPSNGGSINRDPLKPLYRFAEQVTFGASAASGFAFDHWEGGASGTANPLVISYPNQNLTIRAVYRSTTPPPSNGGGGGPIPGFPNVCFPSGVTSMLGIGLGLTAMRLVRTRRRR